MLRSNYAEFTAENLVRLFKEEKDDQAFDQLIKNFYHLIYGTCLKYVQQRADAKDLASEITIQLWEKIPKTEIINFNSWLFSLCKNHCMEFHRKKKKSIEGHLSPESGEILEEHVDESAVNEGVDRPSNIKELELLMAALPDQQKYCMRLFYIKRMSYEKIQTKTGYSFNEIKSALQNGRNRLRNALN